ncbi:MAG: transglutaminase domain-containing protein [Oscillospiraceae bacterium]|nr:transglutaminase domain-containing protein [Oscillospiraceae bacterium]
MKKFAVFMLAFIATVFLVFGIVYAKKSGLLKAYPDAVYMSLEMTGTRIAYQNLNESEKAVYTALYNGILQKSEYIELPFEISGKTYEKIYFNIEKQEPEFFFLAGDFYSAEKIRTAQIIYRDDLDSFEVRKNELESEKNKILQKISGYDDFEKLLYIHDYIAENCTYIESGKDYIETAYGCLVEKNANCEGYAKAFKYLCDSIGIPCSVTVGITSDGINHAWNQVQIDGIWYNVDVTWDDCDDEFEKVHTYFLCSDKDFSSHTPDSDLMPVFKCVSDSENYYIKKDAFIKIQDDAERILSNRLADISENIELKFSDLYTYNEFKNVYMNNQRIFDILSEKNPDVLNSEIRCFMKEFEGNCVIILRFLRQV